MLRSPFDTVIPTPPLPDGDVVLVIDDPVQPVLEAPHVVHLLRREELQLAHTRVTVRPTGRHQICRGLALWLQWREGSGGGGGHGLPRQIDSS